MPPFMMSDSSFLTELFDPGLWPVRFFYSASGEAHLIQFWIYPACCTYAMLQPMVTIVIYIYIYLFGFSQRFILWQAGAGYLSGYGGGKNVPS